MPGLEGSKRSGHDGRETRGLKRKRHRGATNAQVNRFVSMEPIRSRRAHGVRRSSLRRCLVLGRTDVADGVTVNGTDDPLDPDPDFGFWYLVRAANCTGVGSFDAPDPRQAAPRDAGIAASGHSCPEATSKG